MSNSLKKELEHFQNNRSYYLKKYKNKFILIKDEEFVGAYDTEETAYKNALEKFGNEPFLIQKVAEKEDRISFSALYLGMSNASL